MKLDRVIAVRNNKTVFRDGNRCVKIFSPDFSKAGVYAEALNHVKAEEIVSFVPKLLEVIRHDRNWAIVYEFAKGKTLLQCIEEAPGALSDQVSCFVDCQLALHRTEGGSLPEMRQAFLQAFQDAPLDSALKAALQKGLEEKSFPSFLCHLDFVPSNLIVGQDQKPTVIDWASARMGEPLADVAVSYLRLTVRGQSAFAEAYRSEYCKKMQISQSALSEWIPYAAAYLMNSANEAERNALLPFVKLINNKGETK